MNIEKMKPWITLSGGFICHLVLGCFYLVGTTNIYVVSYLRNWDPELSLNSMIVVLPLIIIIQTFFLSAGPLMLKISPAWVPLTIGTTIFCGGVILSSFSKGLAAYLCLYCISMGVGKGFAYITPIVICWEYFPLNKGFVSGVILCGFGLASFLFGFVVKAIINPEGAEPTIETEGGMIVPPDSL